MRAMNGMADDMDRAAMLLKIEELERETGNLKRMLQSNLVNGAKLVIAHPPKRPRNGVHRGNGDGARHRGGQRQRPIDDGAPPGRVKWVSGDDDSKTIARFICGAAMADAIQGFPVQLHAKNDANVNTAIKAVAIAARRCLEDLDTRIHCQARFRDSRTELTITIYAQNAASAVCAGRGETPNFRTGADYLLPDPVPDDAVLSAARNTDYRDLAGAVAKRAREGEASVVRAIGAASVFVAVRALALGGDYLASEQRGIFAAPRFATTKFEGREDETTIVEIPVFPERYQ
ncbi:hypothetical protein M885DRAFT_567265 [Pelagophyceae sp. CCMP2097]|nr:hypothetical protein M885DRAFT_567265 [Pelagophyceae sp. CCMP2097]